MKIGLTYVREHMPQINITMVTGCLWISIILFLTVLPIDRDGSESEFLLPIMTMCLAFVGYIGILIKHDRIFLTWIDIVVMAWVIYITIHGAVYTTCPAKEFSIRLAQIVSLYIALRLFMTSFRIKGYMISMLVIIFAGYEAFAGIIQIINGESRHLLYPATGSFQNPGPYSTYLAIGLVMACFFIRNLRLSWFERDRKYLIRHVLTYIAVVLLFILIITMSRAALLATAISLSIVFREKIKSHRRFAIPMTVGCSIAGVALYLLKPGSADGRMVINMIGCACIADNPLWGSGIGSFMHSYSGKTIEIGQSASGIDLLKVDVLDYPFNDLLRVGVEQGILGLLFASGVMTMTILTLCKNARSLSLGFLTLLIISLFSYPFELLPFQIISTIMTAYASGCSNGYQTGTQATVITGAFLLTSVILPSMSIYRSISDRREAQRIYNMMAGMHDKAFINNYYALLPALGENPRFLFEFATILAKDGRYNDSNAILRRGSLISNDPMFLILQGNNYRDMEFHANAETAYMRAAAMVPNRIYPYYRLMKLYQKTGDSDKTYDMALRIIRFKIKIESQATKEMKAEAKRIILNL